MTVEEMLQLPVLGSATLLTHPEFAKDREITSAAVIEVPVDRFIRPGELVISSGMNVGHDVKLLTRFIQEVSGSQASALALAIGPYTPRIPKRVISAAERAGLPLIELPWEIRFSEISEAILKRIIREQEASRSSIDFVWSLATRNYSEQAALSHGMQLGYDLRRGFAGVVGSLSSPVDGHGQGLQNRLRLAERCCGKAAAQKHLQWLGAVIGGRVVGYIQMPRARRGIQSFLIGARTLANGKYSVSWGVGRICKDLGDFHKSYEDARVACDIGQRMRGQGSITDISDVMADRVLLNLRHNAEVSTLLDRYINPLRAVRRMPLLHTLEVFFDTDCNASETARKLSISRQSLLYRLAKSEALLNIDLHSSEYRFAICLALRLDKLQRLLA